MGATTRHGSIEPVMPRRGSNLSGAKGEITADPDTGVLYVHSASPKMPHGFRTTNSVVKNLGAVSGAVALDLDKANRFMLSLNGATTLSIQNPTYQAKFQVIVQANGVIPVWPSNFYWPSNTPPTLGDNGYDIIEAESYDGGVTFAAFVKATRMFAVIYAEDDFIGAANAPLESHVTNVGNRAWSVTTPNVFKLTGAGRVQVVSFGNASDMAWFDCGQSDYTLTCTLYPYNNGTDICCLPDLVFRMTDVNNYYSVELDPRYTDIYVNQVVAGSGTNIDTITDATVISGNPTVVQVVVRGPLILLFINGIQKFSYSSAFNQGATKVGIRMANGGAPPVGSSWGSLVVG